LISATLGFARPSTGGSRRFVEFQRGKSAVQKFDLYCFFRDACPAMPEVLQDGDTVRVPPRGKLVAISGAVSRPGIYELGDDETAGDLLRYAGGVSLVADVSRVNLYSFGGPGGAERLLRVVPLPSLCGTAAAVRDCTRLGDGDYLDVQARQAIVHGVVTVAAPGVEGLKLELRPGMRLLDVLQAPFDRLIPRKTLDAMNAGAYAALSDLDDRLRRLDLDSITLYRIDRDKREYSTMSVNYRAAVLAAQGPDNLLLQDGDVLTIEDVSNWKLRRDELPMSVRVLGEVGKPGLYRFVGNRTLGEVLQMAGGTTPAAALWSAVVLRYGDGRAAVNKELLGRALKSISDFQIRQEKINSDHSATALQLGAVGERASSGAIQILNTRTQAEALDLLKGRDIIYLAGRDSTLNDQLVLAPNDVVLIPPQQDTFGCQGAFFKAGEFVVGKSSLSLSDAVARCGPMDEMEPNLYHFVARENRVCRKGWLRSCPAVEGGDVIVAVPDIITRRGMSAVLDWMDVSLKTLTTLATVKVLSK
jgi:protein involved in polysaccharide export with SLBB domain